MALAQRPRLLLLDEPTSMLDIGHEQAVLDLVDGLRRDGLTVLSALHDLTIAGQYAGRLVLPGEGRVNPSGRSTNQGVFAVNARLLIRVLGTAAGVMAAVALTPERVSVYTDCTLTGLKHIVAKRKIQSLVAGTRLVRAELTGDN